MTYFTTTLRSLARVGLIVSPLFAGGCFIVDDAALNALVETPDVDAGTAATSEACGGSGGISIMAGNYSVANGNAIDTRNAANDVDPLCSSAPGPDVFVQFDANAGQYWHFHVHANNPPPADGGAPQISDPVLLLYPLIGGVCDTSNCTYISNKCPAGIDEHFGLEIPTQGAWAFGIDSANAFGSRYDVTVFRPTCANNIQEHGEACDDGNLTPDDGCDEKCRLEFSITNVREGEPNDDRFWANHVLATVANTMLTPFEMTGAHTPCDTDTYMVRLAVGEQLIVHLASSTGIRYTPADIRTSFAVHTATGSPLGYAADGNGDVMLTTPIVSASTDYFITVGPPPAGMSDTSMFDYRVQLDVN